MKEPKWLRDGHSCRALGWTSLRMPTICWHCLGVSIHGVQPAAQFAGGTAVLLLIIHPAQLGTADKSHGIAFVLQLDDLRVTGVPFSCTLLRSCPRYLLMDLGTLSGLAINAPWQMPCAGRRGDAAWPWLPSCTSVSTKESCSSRSTLQGLSSPPGRWLCPSLATLPSLCVTSQQQRKAQCSHRDRGERAAFPTLAQPNLADDNGHLTLFIRTFPFTPSQPIRGNQPHALLL